MFHCAYELNNDLATLVSFEFPCHIFIHNWIFILWSLFKSLIVFCASTALPVYQITKTNKQIGNHVSNKESKNASLQWAPALCLDGRKLRFMTPNKRNYRLLLALTTPKHSNIWKKKNWLTIKHKKWKYYIGTRRRWTCQPPEQKEAVDSLLMVITVILLMQASHKLIYCFLPSGGVPYQWRLCPKQSGANSKVKLCQANGNRISNKPFPETKHDILFRKHFLDMLSCTLRWEWNYQACRIWHMTHNAWRTIVN